MLYRQDTIHVFLNVHWCRQIQLVTRKLTKLQSVVLFNNINCAKYKRTTFLLTLIKMQEMRIENF